MLSIGFCGCGDRAGRGGMTGALGVDMMKIVWKLREFNVSLGPTIPARVPRARAAWAVVKSKAKTRGFWGQSPGSRSLHG